ncbi:MAG: prepilin peptidase [Bryobacteraceae bacterium]|nr:prepilin peptidase [Bryobacteraceae bacterium]
MTEAILAGLSGLLIGSFLNVCIYRLPRDLSVVRPRSHCPSCERMISWYDNLPLISWLLLGRRCRHCQASISARYPAVELLTGLLFFAGIYLFGPTVAGAKICLFSAIMIDLIFTDFEERILPDEFTLGGALAGIALAAWAPPAAFFQLFFPDTLPPRLFAVLESALSAVLLAGLLWSIGALYARIRGREGLGFGDVKMVACIGAFLGLSPAVLTIMFGSLLGSVVGLSYIAFTKRDARTYELPFGSFLGIAAVLVALLRPGY